MFKLKPQNALFWIIAPTVVAKYYANEGVKEDIENLWRIHQNRVEKGLGGTYSPSGMHESHKVDEHFALETTIPLPFEHYVTGALGNMFGRNPAMRWKHGMNKYSNLSFWTDFDDTEMFH